MKYSRYVSVLLTLALFAYFGTVMVVEIPWNEVLRGLLLPTFSSNPKFSAMIVAIFGTTISPYLFFWQASQEAEDTKEEPQRMPLVEAPRQGRDAIDRIRTDTYLGMALMSFAAAARCRFKSPISFSNSPIDMASSCLSKAVAAGAPAT